MCSSGLRNNQRCRRRSVSLTVTLGDGDAAFLGATDYIERRIPGSERITIPDAGHMVPATHGEILGALIDEFLKRKL